MLHIKIEIDFTKSVTLGVNKSKMSTQAKRPLGACATRNAICEFLHNSAAVEKGISLQFIMS